MKQLQKRPPTGRDCRSASASLAGVVASATTILPAARAQMRLPMFAQFPPAALFKAMERAVARRLVAQRADSGMGLAKNCVLRGQGEP
jgi:hypothetical protein